jgi:type IV pilus assembly protein PilM
LAKYDEISSTEKLLELIRDEDKSDPGFNGYAPPPPASTRIKTLLKNPAAFKRSLAVGVDMGHEDIKLVKVNRIADQKYEVLDYARVPYNPEYPRQSNQFYQFLRQALINFCGSRKDVDIWCTISSARVETRQLRIPKVPQKQIAASAFWTFQRLSPFDEKEKIFDYELLGEVTDGDEEKLDIMAYIAPRGEVEEVKALFASAGFPITGTSIVPFAFQTLLRAGRIDAQYETVSSLYIGRDWSRIDIFANGTLMLSRGIKAGVRTMIEALRKDIEKNWLELSLAKSSTRDSGTIRKLKSRLKREMDLAQQMFFGGVYGEQQIPVDESQVAIKEERIFRMILPALERLVRQVERTIRHFALNFENARVEKLYISSGFRPHNRISEYIGDELGIPIQAIDPFMVNTNFLTMVPPPESAAEKSSFAPAMGMALSNNMITPNFLFTYKEKKRMVSAQRINRSIFAVFIALIAVCVGISVWQDREIRSRDLQKKQLVRQLEDIDVRVDKNLILKLLDQIRDKNKAVKNIGRDYYGVALLGEIASLTPEHVRLLKVSAKLGSAPGAGKAEKDAAPPKRVLIDGVIKGSRLSLEASLAEYLIALKNSPLFDQPVINKKSMEQLNNQTVIRFTAQLDLV